MWALQNVGMQLLLDVMVDSRSCDPLGFCLSFVLIKGKEGSKKSQSSFLLSGWYPANKGLTVATCRFLIGNFIKS